MTEGGTKIIALTGGIGSGKSVVSRLLDIMGYPVYDCDSRAKRLMDESRSVKSDLQQIFGNEAVVDGAINRTVIAGKAFADKRLLSRLNSLVHPMVRQDIKQWAQKQSNKIAFVETAILKESGLDSLVDEVWEVDAPIKLRVKRVMQRNGMTANDVMARISRQPTAVDADRRINNDGVESLIAQLTSLLKQIKN